ncbi:MAG: 1-acyl-sn-glycerol-3-phosphate acyltransferase [Duncaniella sp.]|nr:1-acyl-sn-glycerol-3-phosphate acyltransferase [Duncaniella sp.]
MNILLLGLYRVYQICIMAPIILVVTILTAVVTVIGSACGFGKWWGYYPEILWARLFCWLSFVTVSVSGRENIDPETSYVFVANHQGAFDIFTVYGWLGHSFRWMMKIGLRKIPFVGWACKWSGQIFVDNSNPAATRKTMEAAERQLRGGMSLVVFPEGARTLDGRIHSFKKGAYRLAVEFGLPVVPLTIDGVYNVMPRTAMLPRPGHIKLTIHKPIHPTTDGHDLPMLMKESFEAISSALPEANRAPATGATPAD